MLCLVSFRNSDRLTVITFKEFASPGSETQHPCVFHGLVLERFLRLISFSLNVVVIVSMFTVA